ncbi:Fe(3+)-hydroxamate ABC transporter permease FhuB, partial [Klebsiella pneumoniae]
ALLALAPLCRRWLTILPLGGEAARAVGMALTSSRIVLLLLAALIGALLLWLSDQVILWLSRVWREVSTGSVTALIGAPL